MESRGSDCTSQEREGLAPVAEGGDGGAGLVFWLLVTLAVAGIAPCLVVPAWRDYQDAELRQRVLAAHVQTARAELERLERKCDAIHNDPVVVSRLAQRELEFHPSDEVAVPVILDRNDSVGPRVLDRNGVAARGAPDHNDIADSPQDSQLPPNVAPISPPAPVARILSLVPLSGYGDMFCQSPSREMILALSGGLFLAAFVIFWPRPTSGTN